MLKSHVTRCLLLISIFSLYATLYATEPSALRTLYINNNEIHVEVANTDQAIKTGLMGRTSLPANRGMIFTFASPSKVTFWMFHTLIPLDMIFIKDGKIIKISHAAQPCKSEDSSNCALYPDTEGVVVDQVLEVNAGYTQKHRIREGDRVVLSGLL